MSEIAELSDFFKYPQGLIPVELWEVDDVNNPCISTRTIFTGFFDSEEETYYIDSDRSSTINGTFFPQDNNYEMYFEIINGKQQIDQTNTCNITSVNYDDMPHPESISVHDQYLLAAYPHYQVVVKYDLRQGNNPLGEVVAGQWGRVKMGPNDSIAYLNLPSMVKWRDDGERFAVYSEGNMKSISFYKGDGTLLRNLQTTGGYPNYGLIPTRMRYHYQDGYAVDANLDDAGGQSFIEALTPKDRLDNVHQVTRLEYVSNGTHWAGTHDVEHDCLYVGMYYRDNDNVHSYKLWAFTPIYGSEEISLNGTPYLIHNFATLSHTSGDNIQRDLISDFAVVKKENSLLEFTNHLYLAYPLGTGFSTAYSQQQNYTAREYVYNYTTVGGGRGIPSVRVLGSRTINHQANQDNLYYGKHVRAEVELKGSKIYVVITSSAQSMSHRDPLVAALIAGIGTGAILGSYALLTQNLIVTFNSGVYYTTGLAKFLTGALAGASKFAAVLAVAGTIVLVAAAAAAIVYAIVSFINKKTYRETSIGLSMSTISGSIPNLTYTESSTAGLVGEVDWIPNSGQNTNNITMDKSESVDNLYAIQLDGSIRKGTWTSNSSTLVLKEVKDRLEP